MTAPTPVRYAPVVGKVTVFHGDTGAAVERWPVDARVLVQSGAYHWAPPGTDLSTEPVPVWARGIGHPAPPSDPLLTPLGERVVLTPAHEATPAATFTPPTGYTGHGKERDRQGRR